MHLKPSDSLVVDFWVVVVLAAWLRSEFLALEEGMWMYMLRRKVLKGVSRRGSVWAVGRMVGVWIEKDVLVARTALEILLCLLPSLSVGVGSWRGRFGRWSGGA